MTKLYGNDDLLSFFFTDVRVTDRLARVLNYIYLVVYSVPKRIIQTVAHDPFECIKTNLIGALNPIDA